MEKRKAILTLWSISFLLIIYYLVMWRFFDENILYTNLIVLAILFLWSKKIFKIDFKQIGIRKENFIKSSFTGLLLGGVVALFPIIYLLFFSNEPRYGAHPVAGLSLTALLIRLLIITPIGTVIFEEIIFRGVLYTGFKKYYSKLKATLLTGLSFMLFHTGPNLFVMNAYETVFSFALFFIGSYIATFLGNILFVFIRERTENLIGSMTAHWIILVLPTSVVWLIASGLI